MFHSATGSKPVVREILTLQVGHYSNCVATHWWNIQDSTFCYDPKEASKTPKEIESDFLFREGKTLCGDVTYTPRAICFDLKDSLRTLKPLGSLYGEFQPETSASWPGDVTLHQTAPHSKNEFLRDLEREEMFHLTGQLPGPRDQGVAVAADAKSDADEMSLSRGSGSSFSPPSLDLSHRRRFYELDDSVEVWSDFLRPHLHPKTVSILPQYTHNDENDALELYGLGANLFNAHPTYEDDVDDRLRFFVEDCDSLQGFQLLVDASDGISGLGARLLEQLADEHSTKCTIAFPVSTGSWKRDDTLARTHRVANTVCSMHALTTHCDLVVPLNVGSNFYANETRARFPRQFPNTNLKPIYYHTSAVLATALESITSVYRRYENPISMSELADMIGLSGRKIAEANLSLPFPLEDVGGSLVGTLLESGGIGSEYPPWQSVSDFADSRTTLSSGGSGGGGGGGGGKRKSRVDSLRRRTRIADVAAQYLHLAGVSDDRVKNAYQQHASQQQQKAVGSTSSSSSYDNPLPRAVSQCSTAEDVLRLYSSQIFPNCLTKIDVMRNPMKTESPFPHIFDHFVGRDGFMVDEGQKRSSHIAIESVPVASCLQNRDATGKSLHGLAQLAGKIDLMKYHKIVSPQGTMEADDFKENVARLKQVSFCYDFDSDESEED